MSEERTEGPQDDSTAQDGGRSLYHYTTAAGLHGIVTTATLWATDLRFLNDAQEALYGAAAMRQAVLEFSRSHLLERRHWGDTAQADHAAHCFEMYRRGVISALDAHSVGLYVSCFCESGDLLSQWRGYGTDHGYAIECATEPLRSALTELKAYPPNTVLTPVRYGMSEAQEVVDAAVLDMASFNGNHPGVKAHYTAQYLAARLATIKHPGFLRGA